MSFAPKLGVSNNNTCFNELDIMNQVANKYVKKILADPNSQVSVDETKMEQDRVLKCLYKVWSGFTKFIRNQCQEKNRAVNTNLIGTFIPRKEPDGSVEFYPSPDF